MLKIIKINISGIHCRSCKTLIETEIDVLSGVKGVDVNHHSGKTTIEFDDKKISKEEIFKEIEKLNYKISDEKEMGTSLGKGSRQEKQVGIKKYIVFVALLILIFGYFLVGRFGGFELLRSLNEGNVGYGIIFIIGLLAGFHCVGMCGGLVVAYSSSCFKTKATKKEVVTPHLQYNLGRFISYTTIGGILGGLGSFFGINPTFTGVIVLVASIFMILMGLSFLLKWEILEKIKLRTPEFIARFLYNQKNSKNPKGPFVIGILNGFMPCGPLQAIQLYALSSGSVITGAVSMGIYSLGTAVLMFGFGVSISKIGEQYLSRIMKFSGILLIILGLIMATRGLANFGYSFNDTIEEEITKKIDKKDFQVVKMELSYLGYKPNVLYIKKDVPVKWVINVKQMTGCTNAIMIESLGIKRDLKIGENIIEFIPPSNVKEIKFSCWMRMVWGKFVVVDDDDIGLMCPPTKKEINGIPQNLCGGN